MKNFVDTAVQDVQEKLHYPPDLTVREIVTPFFSGKVIYIDGLVQTEELEEMIIFPLVQNNKPFSHDFDGLRGIVGFGGNMREIQDITKSILEGTAVLIFEDKKIEFSVNKVIGRTINEPPTSSVVKGPREGFVESIKINCILLRKRIKSETLIFKEISIGERTKTRVMLVYLEDVVKEDIVENVANKLGEFTVDGALDSSYLTKMLEEHPYSLFKQIGNSEKPDVVARKILNGKIALLCDGSPIVLYLPFTLIEDFEDSEDIYKRPFRATFLRYMRFVAACMALLLPSLFVSVQVYQFQLLPVELLVTVINSTGNIPFSPTLEMIIALLLFEILSEASIRMPRLVGMVLGVVGAIVLGDTAVKAGILSSLTVLVVAMSGIGIYTIPDEVGVMGLLRVTFVIFAGLFGLFGILISGMCTIAYVAGIKSFGIPYLTPVAPIFKDDLKKLLVKYNFIDLYNRPCAYSLKDKRRIRRGK